jgi:hypothetical protein
MILQEYFKTPIWVEHKPEWLKEINKEYNNAKTKEKRKN